MNIFLKIYIIETIVSFCIILPFGYRSEKRDGTAHRKAIVSAFLISITSFIPLVCLLVSFVAIKEEIETWIKNDPTLPGNIQKLKNDPPPPKKKKEKKADKVDDRFEIMDL